MYSQENCLRLLLLSYPCLLCKVLLKFQMLHVLEDSFAQFGRVTSLECSHTPVCHSGNKLRAIANLNKLKRLAIMFAKFGGEDCVLPTSLTNIARLTGLTCLKLIDITMVSGQASWNADQEVTRNSLGLLICQGVDICPLPSTDYLNFHLRIVLIWQLHPFLGCIEQLVSNFCLLLFRTPVS